MASPLKLFCKEYVHAKQGRTLIVGSSVKKTRDDRRALYKDVLGVDMEAGPGVDLVHNMEEPLDEKFDHVECTSVLEHCRKPWLVAANVEALMNVGSTITLSVPFVWRRHGYPSDYFRFTAEGVRELFPNIKWKTLIYMSTRFFEDPAEALHSMADASGHAYFPRCEVYGFGRRV